MKKVLLFNSLAILLYLSSCTINDDGELETTWLFWFLLIGFVVMLVYAAVSTSQQKKETDAELRSRGLSNSDFKITESTYVGGHPLWNDNVPYIVYRREDDKLQFYSRQADYMMPAYKFEIPIDTIKNIGIEDATSIESKVTVGRLFFVGIFAFAWKKKKKNELAFVTIEWNDGRFDHTTIFNIESNLAMQKANTMRNNLIRDLNSQENGEWW
jgi:hypothetical protein